MTEETHAAPALTAEQQAATEQLEKIYSDRSHAYNAPGHPRYDAAAAEVLALRRRALGAENRPAVEYREAAADPARVPAETATLSALYGREDFLTGIPGDVPTPERHRAAAAVEACGLTWFEAQQLVNATEGPVPDPADELDLEALWGEAHAVNVRLVKDRMTQLLAVDPDLHDRLLPFLHRRADVLAHVLAVAQRLAQGGGR
jgi:hypothetical protein